MTGKSSTASEDRPEGPGAEAAGAEGGAAGSLMELRFYRGHYIRQGWTRYQHPCKALVAGRLGDPRMRGQGKGRTVIDVFGQMGDRLRAAQKPHRTIAASGLDALVVGRAPKRGTTFIDLQTVDLCTGLHELLGQPWTAGASARRSASTAHQKHLAAHPRPIGQGLPKRFRIKLAGIGWRLIDLRIRHPEGAQPLRSAWPRRQPAQRKRPWCLPARQKLIHRIATDEHHR